MHETSFHPYNKDGQPHAGVFRFDPADGSHGKQHLSSLLATLNILAFLFHSFLTFCDDAYTLIRATLPTRQTFFDHIRCLTCYHCFSSWEAMMDFMMRGLEIGPYAEQNA